MDNFLRLTLPDGRLFSIRATSVDSVTSNTCGNPGAFITRISEQDAIKVLESYTEIMTAIHRFEEEQEE